MSPEVAAIARDPTWFPHRYDPGHDAVHLIRLDRAGHRGVTFLSDEYLPADLPKVVIRRAELMPVVTRVAPVHFLFHSAYCCSTLLARAFDLPGLAMGLKEPMLLQDVVGWRRRGGDPARVGAVLNDGLRLLARPFADDEAAVVKPSNIVNGLAHPMLAMRPDAHALLLHAPLATFLGSIAKKGMWGRLWVRELFVGLMTEGAAQRLGFDIEQVLGQTDLQIAAAGWLAQHALFTDLVRTYGARVRTLDSETLVAHPARVMTALGARFNIAIDDARADAIARGPAFSQHSKHGSSFDAAARAEEQQQAAAVHGDEIAKVAAWAEAVARNADIPLVLANPLLA